MMQIIIMDELLAEVKWDGDKNYFMEIPEIVRKTDKEKNYISAICRKMLKGFKNKGERQRKGLIQSYSWQRPLETVKLRNTQITTVSSAYKGPKVNCPLEAHTLHSTSTLCIGIFTYE
jgi:hypothetical protein